jgi:hypothetical protein
LVRLVVARKTAKSKKVAKMNITEYVPVYAVVSIKDLKDLMKRAKRLQKEGGSHCSQNQNFTISLHAMVSPIQNHIVGGKHQLNINTDKNAGYTGE